MHPNEYIIWPFHEPFYPNHCLLWLSMFLSTFFLPISTEGWKCDFFVRHNAQTTIWDSNVPPPKRRFWKVGQTFQSAFSKHFHAPQTKILEGGTKDEMRISKEALFKGVSAQFGTRAIEKTLETPHLIFCSAFQNLRLGGVKLGRMHKRGGAPFRRTFQREGSLFGQRTIEKVNRRWWFGHGRWCGEKKSRTFSPHRPLGRKWVWNKRR